MASLKTEIALLVLPPSPPAEKAADPCFQAKDRVSARSMMLLLQRRNALAQFVYCIVEMTDCILEAILEPVNSIIQAFIGTLMGAVTGRLCRSIWHDWLSGVRSCSFAV